MSENLLEKISSQTMKRRTFLKWTGAVAAPAVLGGATVANKLVPSPAAAEGTAESVKVVPTCGTLNCGGKCLIKAHVKDGTITRLSTDDDPRDKNADSLKFPQIRACVRGRGYRRHVYHPDRIKTPLRRTGKRGEGKFKEISWEEAIKEIASESTRIKEKYGPASRYGIYATGQTGQIGSGDTLIQRLLACDGGFLGRYSNYSSGQHGAATPYTFGVGSASSSLDTLVDSKLIVLNGFNPAETIFGHFNVYLRLAKKAGAKIYIIDPRNTDTAVGLADDWFPIKPTTDNALIAGMAHVMFSENLQDQAFLDQYCIGHDEEHMPEGVPAGESYKSYIMGVTDGVEKTPEWAAKVTGLPAHKIKQLAREVASTKPMAWIQGNGINRHMNGEQLSRGGSLVAALTGNIGVKGGWAGPGAAGIAKYVAFPSIENPTGLSIPCFRFTDAIADGENMGTAEGVKGLEEGQTLPSNIKMIFNIAGNALINQHSDINKTIELISDESQVEFIVTTDLYMTPSAKYSDIILPTCTFFEQSDFVPPWSYGQHIIMSQKVIEPLFDSKTEYEWMTELARELGVEQQFTEGRTQDDWVKWIINETRKEQPDFPTYEQLKKTGIHKYDFEPVIAFEAQIKDLKNNPFETSSGKIELFSKDLWDMDNPEEIPAIPKHVLLEEGAEATTKGKYPLQLIGWHSKRRTHSSYDTSDWMEEVEGNIMWMNPIDADERDIKEGDLVKVFNDRGALKMPVKVTSRILPGVMAIPQGGWFTPDKDGIDTRGSINVLTTHKATALGHCNPQHTNLAQAEKA
ncbi:DMSO/selenate family reductase complex A subunit [Bacillus mesophilum]|uniref:Molybdopterin-dependent oxidoreductase n=1 Tax=Bacillus mesophilum TaxID=1071718 RepID=A0A7V7UVI7_9BACI|nr:DMSO/selenate family reductase complex A subunit [Bacillus mesophilum]KAB2332812.1 molybdopterin-dependent oxidoreductase [Bacillus mesophilum]